MNKLKRNMILLVAATGIMLPQLSFAQSKDAKHINVVSEFAPLKRVVVAESEFVFSLIPLKETDFLESVPAESSIKRGRPLGDSFPEQQKKWEKEREDFVKLLQKYGVEVLRPRKLTKYEMEMNKEKGSCNFFSRDPFFTIGNYVIEGSLRFAHRRNEILPMRDILVSQTDGSNAIYVAVPKPDISDGPDSEKGPFLEGGDVIVYGKHIFVGNSGLASNEAGYRWLKNLLEPQGYVLEMVPLDHNVLHLDCAMSLVRDGLMIVSPKAMLKGIPDFFKDWDKIVLEPEVIKYLTINGLPINKDTYVTDIKFKDTVGKELEKRGIKVEYLDFAITRTFGGSFRCSTQPLLRE